MKTYIINAIILDKKIDQQEISHIILNTYVQAESEINAISYLQETYNVVEIIDALEYSNNP